MKLSTLAVIAWAAPTSAQSTLPAPIQCDGDFNDGVYLGADVAEAIWREGGSSCNTIWGYEDAVDDYLDENYPDDTGNWQTDACHDGMEKGADQVVAKYEQMCLDASPQECYELGETAAQSKPTAFMLLLVFFTLIPQLTFHVTIHTHSSHCLQLLSI